MRIIMWLKENTFCTYYDAYKSVVPTGFSYTFSQHYSLVNTYIDEDTLNEDEKKCGGLSPMCKKVRGR